MTKKSRSYIQQRLAVLRGGRDPRPVTARVIAGQAANTRCALLAVANAAGVSLDHVLKGTSWEVPYGMAAAALARGNSFERMVKENGYAHLLTLLQSELGFDVSSVRVENLRARYPVNPRDPYVSLRARAAETKTLVAAILRGDPQAPNIIDGAVLVVEMGGQQGFLETDAMAFQFGSPIHVGEVKSFPIVDGRADPAKVGDAADQGAVYVLALQDLVGVLGGDPTIVSTELLLIGAKNTGMIPVLHRIDVARRVAHHRRQLAAVADISDVLAAIPVGLAFPESKAADAADVLAEIADETGTHYDPACLSHCGCARWCRDRARAAGDPARLGGSVVRLMPGVRSLDRAAELARGAPPTDDEAATAGQLVRALRVVGRVTPVELDVRRRRRGTA